MAEHFNIVAVGQNGRLQYEAILLAASFKASNPGFPGTFFLAEPQPGPHWPHDPRITDPATREALQRVAVVGGAFDTEGAVRIGYANDPVLGIVNNIGLHGLALHRLRGDDRDAVAEFLLEAARVAHQRPARAEARDESVELISLDPDEAHTRLVERDLCDMLIYSVGAPSPHEVLMTQRTSQGKDLGHRGW